VSLETVVTGKRAIAEAIKAGRASRVLVAASAKQTQGLREVLGAAEKAHVLVEEVPRAELDAITDQHRGVLAYASAPDELSERDLATWPFEEDAIVVVLDGITDPQNLGACARAADAAGAAMLVSRVKRSAGVTPSALRASAGALVALPHARVANIPRALERLQTNGFTAIGLDADGPTDIYSTECAPGRVALVVGSEGEGLSRLVGEGCDELVSLPMRGQVASMNASNSLAAALFGYVLARGR
jgi:23S rRNA (guanosine2251-2'-O)-methyltransferase